MMTLIRMKVVFYVGVMRIDATASIDPLVQIKLKLKLRAPSIKS